jgi:hypothetical protein
MKVEGVNTTKAASLPRVGEAVDTATHQKKRSEVYCMGWRASGKLAMAVLE